MDIYVVSMAWFRVDFQSYFLPFQNHKHQKKKKNRVPKIVKSTACETAFSYMLAVA